MARLTHTLSALVFGAALADPAFATDIWVSGTGDNSNQGTESQPYRTITWAMLNASTGDTIKVKSGVYDVDAGEVLPIDIKHNVDVLGQETDVEDWPRIGGDVNVSSSSVEALLRVQATTANRTGIDVRKLYFVGEDYSGKDGPSAFVVRVNSGKLGRVTFENNICERSAMNASGNAGRPTVLVEPGYGTTSVTILNNRELGATARAGIEIKNGTDTTSTHVAYATISLRDNTVMVEGADEALYGVAYIGTGEAWVPGAVLTITGNTIESRDPTGSGGIHSGLYVSLSADGGEITLLQDDFKTIRNSIEDCGGDGIWLRNVPLAEVTTSNLMSIKYLERNSVRGCGGSALRIQRSDTAVSDYAGYLHVETKGNLFAQNDLGVRVIDTVGGSGGVGMLNDTIASNTSFGLKFEGSFSGGLLALINAIVYGNNVAGGGAQYDGGEWGWYPASSTVQHCDFQGFSDGEGNIDADPKFVNAANGDFHLDDDPASPCIDAGDNSPDLTEIDIDGQDRLQDSDDDGEAFVDMGADEVPDPNP